MDIIPPDPTKALIIGVGIGTVSTFAVGTACIAYIKHRRHPCQICKGSTKKVYKLWKLPVQKDNPIGTIPHFLYVLYACQHCVNVDVKAKEVFLEPSRILTKPACEFVWDQETRELFRRAGIPWPEDVPKEQFVGPKPPLYVSMRTLFRRLA